MNINLELNVLMENQQAKGMLSDEWIISTSLISKSAIFTQRVIKGNFQLESTSTFRLSSC